MARSTSKPTTVAAYLASLPDDRRRALEAIRTTIRKNLDPAMEEGIQYGMIGYYVPHSVYPAGYHCDPRQPLPFASIASQKNHIGIYLFCLYQDPALKDWFVQEWTNTGKRLDMGASCFRVKDLSGVPLALLGRAIKKVTAKKFIAQYESQFGDRRKPASKKTTAKKSTKKTVGSKKTAQRTAKKSTSKKTATKEPAAGKKTSKASATKKTTAKKTSTKKSTKKKSTTKKTSRR